MNAKPKIRLGDLLVAQKLITNEQLNLALSAQKETGKKLGRQLIDMAFVEENELLSLLAKQLNYPFFELRQFDLDRNLVNLLPETIARRYRVIILKEDEDGIFLGMSDPTDIFCLDDIQKILKKPIKPAIVRESELLDILDIAYSRSSEIATLAEELHESLGADVVDIDSLSVNNQDSDAPVVKLLQKIFEESVKTRASDIHIEPDEDMLRIRQRVDGVLIEQVMSEINIAAALVVRLKLMASLDISEKRLPQDGRFNVKVSGQNIDVRISTMPIQYGESIVMRLLNQSQNLRSLNHIGMNENDKQRFRQLIKRPHGLVLVTGPTGSGKTTTLYAALSELNTAEKKIVTVEDPVEYRLPRLSQIQVHDRIGLGFEKVLRSVLRQDPDILLIGEIRDAVSAEIALRASMTGHLVLSTLHTNDAIGSALRLLDMGIDAYLVASSLKAVIAQRLIRKNCEQCIFSYEPDEQERNILSVFKPGLEIKTLKRSQGCVHCHQTGYQDRIGVFEILEMNEPMLIALRESDMAQFNRAAREHKLYRPLGLSAFDYALEGLTTLDEVLRVSAEVEDESVSLIEDNNG